LGIGFPKLTKWVYYRFEFPLKEFMQKARSLEASPTVLLSALMLAATIYLPWAQGIFGTSALMGNLLWQALAFSFAVPLVSSVFTKRID
jgi:hypothetical protein